MAYGIIKVDTVTFTSDGVDKSVTLSGLVQNPTFSGNVTVTGTVSGNTIQGQTISGVTVTGTTSTFATGSFVSLTGTTIQGTTASYTSGGFTSLTGVTTSGTTANFVSGVFSSQISGTTASFTSGVFTNISGGTHTVTSGVFAAGSAASPSISFTSDPDTGLYSPGANQVALSTNGTGRLFIDASGRVGVGGSPSQELHVYGTTDSTLRLQSTSDNRELNIACGHTGFDADQIIGQSSSLRLTANGFENLRLAGSSIIGYTSGSEKLRITSAGLVGIGTSSPAAGLDVRSTVAIRPNSAGSWATAISNGINILTDVATNNNSVSVLALMSDRNDRYATIDCVRGSSSNRIGLAFQTSHDATPTEKVRITSDGLVGIGTTSPASTLDVNGDVTITDKIIHSGDTNTAIRFPANDTVSIETAGSERARIDSSGRLLVGTSSPITTPVAGVSYASIREQLAGTDANTSTKLIAQYSASTSFAPTLAFAKSQSSTLLNHTVVTGGTIIGRITAAGSDGTAFIEGARIDVVADSNFATDSAPSRLVFSSNPGAPATAPAEAMRINSAQELLIGYTSDNGAYKLQVNSQIFATSTTIATSDGRYKENVAALDGCVDLVKALRPVSFDWKAQEPVTRVDEDGETVVVREAHNFPDGKQVGFIAQEVEEVLADKPWLGSVIKQNVRPAVTDADGNELAPEEEFLGIAEGNLVAVLTSALKEAIGRIETLEAEVAALKAS